MFFPCGRLFFCNDLSEFCASAERLLCSSLLIYWFFVMILASFVPVPRFSVRHPQILKRGTRVYSRSLYMPIFSVGFFFSCRSFQTSMVISTSAQERHNTSKKYSSGTFIIASLTFACLINVPRHAAPESLSLRSVISRGSDRSNEMGTTSDLTILVAQVTAVKELHNQKSITRNPKVLGKINYCFIPETSDISQQEQ